MGSKEKQSFTLTKDGNIIKCKRDKFVPIVVLGDCVDTRPRSDAVPVSGDRPPTAPEVRQRNLPDWLQQYTEGLNDGEWRSFVSVLGKRFRKHLPHIFQRNLRTNLKGHRICSLNFRRTSNGGTCKRTKITRVPCRRNPESPEDRIYKIWGYKYS